MPRNDGNVTLEDITIAFRNFAGKEDTYNRAGDRNFAILLEPDMARKLEAEGWNIKFLKVREEGDEPQPYIQVAVSFKNKPPKVAMVTSKGMSYLGEDMIEMLDWADIAEADVTLSPYEWEVGDKSGVKAYVKSLFVRIVEDYLEEKWTAYVEKNRRLSIGPSSADYLDGEIVEDTLELEEAR
jgi:hypothetical protein